MNEQDSAINGTLQKHREGRYALIGAILLTVGSAAYYFTRITTHIPTALLISLICLLAFERMRRPIVGPSIIIGMIFIVRMLLADPLSLIGTGMHAVFVSARELNGALVFALPFLFDRLIHQKLEEAGRNDFCQTFAFPAAATTLAFLNGRFGLFDGVGILFAYTGHGSRSLVNILSIFGIWGGVFFASWSASTALWAWERRRDWMSIRRGATVYGAVTFFLLVYGGYVSSPNSEAGENPVLRTGSVVINYPETDGAPNMEVVFEEREFTSLDVRLAELDNLSSRAAGIGAQLVSTQEFYFLLSEDEIGILKDGLSRIAAENKVHLVAHYAAFPPLLEGSHDDWGGLTVLTDEEEGETVALLYSDEGKLLIEYEKENLGLGEHIWFDRSGQNIQVAETNLGRIGLAVCRDMSFPAFMRRAGRKKADLVVAPAYETMRAHSIARNQALRGVESGFAVLRPTANGLSLAMDARGRTVAEMSHFSTDSGLMIADIPIGSRWTLYRSLGDLLPWLCLAVLPLMATLPAVLGRKRSENVR